MLGTVLTVGASDARGRTDTKKLREVPRKDAIARIAERKIAEAVEKASSRTSGDEGGSIGRSTEPQFARKWWREKIAEWEHPSKTSR
jgi:signal recognition particle subunit SEC65